MSQIQHSRTHLLGSIVLILCAIAVAALLFPSIVIQRERPRRTQCLNNLKNLAFATVDFETLKNRYPGHQELFGRSDAKGKIGSWVVSLMPFIEQPALRDLWDDPSNQVEWEEAFSSRQSAAPFYPEIVYLICPASIAESAPRLSYFSNNGFYIDGPRDPSLQLAAYLGLKDPSKISTKAQRPDNGIFSNQLPEDCFDPVSRKSVLTYGPAKARTFSGDIRDGLSQTLLFSENVCNASWRDISVSDDSGRFRLGVLWHYAGDAASPGRPAPPHPAPEMLFNGKSLAVHEPNAKIARPASLHIGIVSVALADGSVTSLSSDTDYHVYQALMTPYTAKSDIPDADHQLRDEDWRQ